MEIHRDSSPSTTVAQIVRPYDPSTMPAPAAAETNQAFSPVIGLIVATLVVVAILVFTLRKRRKIRR